MGYLYQNMSNPRHREHQGRELVKEEMGWGENGEECCGALSSGYGAVSRTILFQIDTSQSYKDERVSGSLHKIQL